MTGINNSGTVVGQITVDLTVHAMRWDGPGRAIDLGTLGANPGPYPPDSRASGINDAGIVIGSASTSTGSHAVRWDRNGRITDLGDLGGGFSSAFAISDSGVIVGMASLADGHTHAALWRRS